MLRSFSPRHRVAASPRLSLSILCALAATASPVAAQTRPAGASATQPGNVVTFQPGVRIDYPNRCVEVDGEVVLREGLLELFACSPGTREYESIVRLSTRPVVVFQALGLLGLEPGRPLRMDPETAEIIPATGDPLEIEVRYEESGEPKTVPIETWMRRADTKGPLERQSWVFAGSFRVQNGAIAADEEGTIIAVVDFESALVALPRHHTASNQELWLEPNTPAIPALGTECTVLFRPGPLRIRLDRAGRLHLGGKPIGFAELARKLRDFSRENPKLGVQVDAERGVPAESLDQLKILLDELKIEARLQPVVEPDSARPPREDSSTNDAKAIPRWLAGMLVPAATQPESD